MKFIILITTFNRLPYIKQLIESIREHSNPNHEYQIVVNDDGSTDGTREYLESQPDITVLYSQNKQVHHADNNLILFANSQEYDFGFKMDDDLYIIKKGWEDLYYNTYVKTWFAHLVFHDFSWSNPTSRTPETCQGAFWTFTKEALENIGFIDQKNFGKRGWGHGDFTARACRLGYNRGYSLIDAENSNDYIKLHAHENYIYTPNYSEELTIALKDSARKHKILQDNRREYGSLFNSVLNHFFDHIYILNLPRRKDRRERMEQILKSNNIHDFEFWDATDGHSLPMNRGISAGANGCAQSHLDIYEDIKKKGYRRPLILEDDVIFISDLHRRLLSLYSVPNDWTLLYLGASDYNHPRNGVKSPYYSGRKIDGTFAYAVNGLEIDHVIKYAKANNNIPIDTRLHAIQDLKNCYIIHPMICIADLTGSDIRQDRNTEGHAKLVNWDLKLYER